MALLYPKQATLAHKLDDCTDALFVDFIRTLLTVEPEDRCDVGWVCEGWVVVCFWV